MLPTDRSMSIKDYGVSFFIHHSRINKIDITIQSSNSRSSEMLLSSWVLLCLLAFFSCLGCFGCLCSSCLCSSCLGGVCSQWCSLQLYSPDFLSSLQSQVSSLPHFLFFSLLPRSDDFFPFQISFPAIRFAGSQDLTLWCSLCKLHLLVINEATETVMAHLFGVGVGRVGTGVVLLNILLGRVLVRRVETTSVVVGTLTEEVSSSSAVVFCPGDV